MPRSAVGAPVPAQQATAGSAIHLRHLSKRFGGVKALTDVELEVRSGEVHALLGQNGSGKSTLIKILAGYHVPEPGAELQVNGLRVHLPLQPGQFRDLGISFVHQDLGLADTLTVLDNLRIGRYQPGRVGRISWRRERGLARQALGRFDLAIDLDARVGRLHDIERAQLAIVRAVQDIEAAGAGGLLVLDEPTVYLPADRAERLFRIMRGVAATGKGVLFVTHQLREVMAVADRVTVLRDGRVVGTVRTSDTTEGDLVDMIVGRAMTDFYPEPAAAAEAPPTLRVTELGGGMVSALSLSVAPGEVLGLTGLVGMGSEDVPMLIYGARRAQRGEIAIGRRTFRAADMTPEIGRRHGVVLVPANRLRDSIVTSLTVGENVALPVLPRFFRGLRLRLGALNDDIARRLFQFDVRPPDPGRKMSTLSGGNQQKCVLAKWLQTNPLVLLMHEPTQGVDVGARKEIFAIIREVASAGASIVIASCEHEDLANICTRVLVFRDGAVVRELAGQNLSPARVLEASLRSERTA